MILLSLRALAGETKDLACFVYTLRRKLPITILSLRLSELQSQALRGVVAYLWGAYSVVAIHGLHGHPFKTWENRDGHLWLRDSLPTRVPKVRVMTFGYDSVVLFGRSRSTITDFAADLIVRLDLNRQHIGERQRPLIFICHSLGGVVFKELLVSLSLQRTRCQQLLQSIFGVVFMGTPHRGSRAATMGNILSRIVNAATLGTAIRSDPIRTLSVSSVELETISRHATQLLETISIVSFYEQKPIGPSLVRVEAARTICCF